MAVSGGLRERRLMFRIRVHAFALVEQEFGANMDEPNRGGSPPLHQAVIREQVDVVRVLIARGAKVNQRDEVGWPPLHWAASRHNLAVIDMLLDAGAEVNARDLSGQTALQRAWSDDSTKALLRAHGAERGDTFDCSLWSFPDIHERLLSAKWFCPDLMDSFVKT